MTIDFLTADLCGELGEAAQIAGPSYRGFVGARSIRDSAVIDEMPIGVRALSTHPHRSVKRDRGRVDVELSFSGVVIRLGDLIHADADG